MACSCPPVGEPLFGSGAGVEVGGGGGGDDEEEVVD